MRWLRWVLGVFAVLLGLLSLAPLALYLHFVLFANTELEPTSPDRFPRAALELIARDLGCREIPAIPRLNAYTYLLGALDRGYCSAGITGQLSKHMAQARPQLRCTAISASAAIWVSRHWTSEQALATLLERSYFGRGTTGLEAAARLYFARSSHALTREELAQLIAITRAPRRSSPWCDPERNRALANRLLGRDEDAPIESRLAPVPAGYCAR